jgi:hypothetical protein
MMTHLHRPDIHNLKNGPATFLCKQKYGVPLTCKVCSLTFNVPATGIQWGIKKYPHLIEEKIFDNC